MDLAAISNDIEKIVVSEEQIQNRLKEMAAQVLKDYEHYTNDRNSLSITICRASKLFKEVWEKQRNEVRVLAKEFLDYYCITNVELGVNLLFVNNPYSYEDEIETRIDFLKYLINERQEILD